MSTYIAQFETTKQISPDDWKVFRPALEVNDNTTIGEIKTWVMQIEGIKDPENFTLDINVTKLNKLK